MQWEEAPCIQLVDRSRGETVVELRYDIPYETPSKDPLEAWSDDEVADGRTHQFFAFCEDPFRPWPPLWIDHDDLRAAAAKGLIPTEDYPTLDSKTGVPCWVPITTSDERRPISFEAAEAPVLWDVSGVEAGTYTLWGYTWDPPFNVWSPRSRTAIKVHDGDPALAGPSVVLTSGEIVTQDDEEPVIEGCIDAVDGTRLTFEHAEDNLDEELIWESIAEDVEVEGPNFSVALPGDWGLGTYSLVRVTATTPDGLSSTAYLHARVVRFIPPDCEEAVFIEAAGCDEEPDDDAKPPRPPADVPEDTENSPGQAAETNGCRLGPPVALWPLFLLLPAGISPRRRRTR
ncbi:MAG: hypothetical protein AAGA54_31150 [Myxococcota bacterium]